MSTGTSLSLMTLWHRHKSECRAIGSIVADARAGALPGVTPAEGGFGFRVIDEAAALAAMQAQPGDKSGGPGLTWADLSTLYPTIDAVDVPFDALGGEAPEESH